MKSIEQRLADLERQVNGHQILIETLNEMVPDDGYKTELDCTEWKTEEEVDKETGEVRYSITCKVRPKGMLDGTTYRHDVGGNRDLAFLLELILNDIQRISQGEFKSV